MLCKGKKINKILLIIYFFSLIKNDCLIDDRNLLQKLQNDIHSKQNVISFVKRDLDARHKSENYRLNFFLILIHKKNNCCYRNQFGLPYNEYLDGTTNCRIITKFNKQLQGTIYISSNFVCFNSYV